MTRRPLPTRTLPPHPHLDQLKRQAKELLEAFRSGESAADTEVRAHYRGPDPATFALHDAQLVLARAYGFESWPKLKAFVDGATVQRLVESVRKNRIDEVNTLLSARPELARMSADNLQVIHHAVLAGAPEMVRVLMAHGADARQGVYPFPEATTAHAIARQRGRDDIVRIIEDAEHSRRDARSGRLPGEPAALHRAAFALDRTEVARLLDEGADPNDRGYRGLTPADAVAYRWYRTDTRRAADIITLLLARGAAMTPAAAVVLDDAAWLRARHDEGALTNDLQDAGGLLRIAVTHDRARLLALLLDWGFDPDERIRFTPGDEPVEASWGMPLQAAVNLARYDMAAALLERGADPNAAIYASGDPVMAAYERRDARMIALLERYGGVPTAGTIGSFGPYDLARRALDGDAPCRLEGNAASIAEQMLWGAAREGRADVVALALERLDWARDDPRWFSMLEQTLRHDSDPSVASWDDSPHVTCLRLLLDRCDPNVRGRPTDRQQFGLTALHALVARGNLPPAERRAFARALLDKGARLDVRDHLLKSTPLGWACRWGHLPLVQFFLEHGADPVEADAEAWATPLAWARHGGYDGIVEELERRA
ncbi:MAG TPA: ankyrin repeat domain-containing protein [Vicinamibacterales bacterium]|nr:ankyrin repeat domain-containing protein [Vicinamibacterales bacterium]